MRDLLYVSFDESEDDVPALCVGREIAEGEHTILNIITGKRAKKLYETLTISKKENTETEEQLPGQLDITNFI